MRYIILFLGALCLTTAAFAKEGTVKIEKHTSGIDYVPCLGLYVEWNTDVSGVIHTFYDANGGTHYMYNAHWITFNQAIGADMTWLGHGHGNNTTNVNANNFQANQTSQQFEISIANGDYPSLIWRFIISGAYNAKGELVTIRIDSGSFDCVPE
jgi:hypothetical protein